MSDPVGPAGATRVSKPSNQQKVTSTVSYLNESLARTQLSERVGEAHHLRRGHHMALAKRRSRRAERAALQMRLVLARTL